MPVKLSFGEVLAEGFGLFFGNLRLFFHLVTIPWVISVAIRLAGAALAADSILAVLIEKVVDMLPSVMFLVAWQRAVLLGAARAGRLPGTGWSARESAWLAHLIKVAGITFLLIVAFIFTVGPLEPGSLAPSGPLDPDMMRRQAMAAPLGVGFIVSTLLALRVSYGLAATAVDVPFSPRLSWAYSRGNAWTVTGALFLSFFASALATSMTMLVAFGILQGIAGAQEGAAVVAWTAGILVSYGGAGVVATVQAVIFRRLTSWRDGAPLPAPPT